MDQHNLDFFLSQVMQGANTTYKENQPISGVGFVLGQRTTAGESGKSRVLLPATKAVRDWGTLSLLSETVRKASTVFDAQYAGMLCEIPISLNHGPPVPRVLLYVDQKFGGMRVFLAERAGTDLVFVDLGDALPGSTFLPPLIPVSVYGPIVAEA